MRQSCWYFTLVLSISVAIPSIAAAQETIELSPCKADTLTRVVIHLEAGGHTLVRAEGDTEGKLPEQKLPMSVTADIEYDEQRLASTADFEDGTPTAVRYYDKAEAVIKVDNGGRTPKLDDDYRLIVVESTSDRARLVCPTNSLTREQLDLIDIGGDAAAYNTLLPSEPVAVDATWSNDAASMASLLTLDSVAVCEVKSVLESFNNEFAKVRFAGTVQGTADGAATEIEVRAVYLYDRQAKQIAKMNLAIRERRSIGGATPGVDAVAKLQIDIKNIEKSSHLNEAEITKALDADRTTARTLLYESTPLGLRFQHDRQWYVTGEQRESVTLRRVDKGDLVAQCTLAALPPKSAGRQTSLEQFQKDVTYALGKNFGEMVSSRQWQNAAGLYCYELVVRGIVDEVPVEWHYYLLAPESGNRVSVAITLEKPMVERVGNADRDLVESLQIFPRMRPAETATRPTDRAAK